MNSLSLQLEAQENEHKEVGAIKNQLQHAMEQKKLQETELNAANQELEKLKSENKVLLKHDQVCISIECWIVRFRGATTIK